MQNLHEKLYKHLINNYNNSVNKVFELLNTLILPKNYDLRSPSSRVWRGSRINHHPLKTPSYKNGHKCRIFQPSVALVAAQYQDRVLSRQPTGG